MSRPEPTRANGFTLLEMMVALAVFGLAALALMRLQAYSLRSAGEVESHSLARVVAQNLATEFLSDPNPPTLGKRSGSEQNGGRPWAWTVSVSRTADARIVRADIGVIDPIVGRPYILTLARPVEQ